MKTFKAASFKKFVSDIGRRFIDDLIGHDVCVELMPGVSVSIVHRGADGIVVYATADNTCSVEVVGRVDFSNSVAEEIVAMHYFVERVFQQNPLRVINARRFDSIDDLFVGEKVAA